ncbi:MAG: tetratricopeptide repeat protein [Anaerolineales bacterium]|nr:tetratricopeptide repeat protein [Anaerolineales bacterium]
MYRDADIISELERAQGEETAHESVERILRIPQAWEALQEPDFLSEALNASGGQALFPSLIAALSLGAKQLSEVEALDDGPNPNLPWTTMLQSTAKQALELYRMERSSGAQKLVEFMLGASRDWQSAFICAWPEFEDHAGLFSIIAENPHPELGQLIASTLLAYMSVPQAVAELLALKADLAFKLLPYLQNEQELYRALRNELSELSDLYRYDPEASIQDAAGAALILSQLGRTDDAHQALRGAWDRATQQTASVADHLAEVASHDKDPILEAEARQQALEAYPTSIRRSRTALSLLQTERYEDALNLVREGSSFEENTAAGMIYLAIQDMHTAGKKLNQAAQQSGEVIPRSPYWFEQLARGLRTMGFSVQAIHVYLRLIENFPARADLRAEIAGLYSEIGDLQSAIQHANIAIVLNPQDLLTRELLANCLEQLGDAEAALTHWEHIADQDLSKNIQLGQCALSAGDPVHAKRAAERVLYENPEDVAALILAGRALFESGKHAEAKTILKDVTERSPDDADAWIALAASMEATNEAEQAGQTLHEALQAIPDHAGLHMARAAWLEKMDRPAEALDHAATATVKNPDRTDWLLQHASLLDKLGYFEDARHTLETIIASEPANWTAKEQLARTCQKLDDDQEMLRLVRSAPADLKPDSAFFVGQTLAQVGSSPDDLEQATRRLEDAKSAGVSDPSLEYWLAVSQRKQEQHHSAAKHFLRYLEAVKDSSDQHYLDAVIGFARSALEVGEITLALTQLEKAKPSFPTSRDLLSTLAEAQFAAGNREKSIETAREALELYPDSQPALQTFKLAAERCGDLDDAIDAQRKITALTPDHADHWLDMARIEQKRGEIAASREALARAIALGRQDAQLISAAADLVHSMQSPRLEIRLRKRATILDQQNDRHFEKLAEAAEFAGDLETASQAWLECASRNPKDARILLPGAKSLWKLNRRTAAVGLLQQSVTVAPENAAAHIELGRALIGMNDIERGLNEISTAISLEPENSVMRAQAGSIFARYASPEEGLTMLNGSPSAGKFPDVAEARAECYWMNGSISEAQKALDTIPAAVPFSAKGSALRTLICLAAGDSEKAGEEFEQIQAMNIPDSNDLEWAVKAGLSAGKIQSTLDILQTINKQEPVMLENLLNELQARIQIENLTWIHSTLAHSSSWASELKELEHNLDQIDALIIKIESSPLPGDSVESAKQLRDMVGGRIRAASAEPICQAHGFSRAFLQQCHAIALLRANRPLKALQALEQPPEEPYEHALSALIQGLAFSSANQHESAQTSFNTAAGFGALSPVAHYFEASMWEKAGSSDQAISSMNEAISRQPSEPVWHAELASFYRAANQLDAALPHLQQAAELAPDDAQILVELARAYRENGQPSDAEEIYARCLQANPSSPLIWKEAGQVALESGDDERAEAWFERSCTLLPADAACVIGSAKAAQRLGKTNAALERARRAFNLAPEDPQVLSGLGDILAENGSLDRAIQVYDRAMRISEQSPEIRLARSKLLLTAERPQESVTDLEQLLEIDPDHHEAWETLARAYAAINEFDDALHAAQQAVNISPRSVDYRLLMAKLCRQSGQLDRALEILSEIELEAPDRVEIAREKGIVHEERRELELAIGSYNRALSIDSHDAQTVVRAGLLLKQLKAYEESAELLSRGAKLLPNDADLHQQLAAVRALQFVHGNRIEEQVVAS